MSESVWPTDSAVDCSDRAGVRATPGGNALARVRCRQRSPPDTGTASSSARRLGATCSSARPSWRTAARRAAASRAAAPKGDGAGARTMRRAGEAAAGLVPELWEVPG